MSIKIPIEVSARHIHLSKTDLERLFGKNYKLKKIKNLSQPRDFSSEETLDISSDKNKISGVRIVGPERKETQIELSMTDTIYLGIKPVMRLSGNVKNTPGINIIGPKGGINIEKGVIVAKRHIHLNPEEAKKLKIKNNQKISVRIKGESERGLVFENVIARVNKDYKLCVHLDTDEGNASGINKKITGYLIL